MPNVSKCRLLSPYEACKNSFCYLNMKRLHLYFIISLQLSEQVLLLTFQKVGRKRLHLHILELPSPLQLLTFPKTSLKTFLNFIYFSSQSLIDTGNKQYALCLLLSNLVCTVINLHNVSQTGLCSLMTPGTPLGILVGKTPGVFQDTFPIV